jgi:hypothetical protein
MDYQKGSLLELRSSKDFNQLYDQGFVRKRLILFDVLALFPHLFD